MLTTILCIILLLMAIFLTVAVLMQHGKSHNLSGTIAGGAETFFGKTKGRSVDAMLSKVTTIVAIIFVILVVVVYVIQEDVPTYEQIPVEGTEVSDVVEGTENAEGEENAEAADPAEDAAPVEDAAEAGEEVAESTEPPAAE